MPITKTDKILRELLTDLAAGKLGVPGDRFLTTRELTTLKDVSLKTAFHIIGELKESGVIQKTGRDYRIVRLTPPQRQENSRMLLGFMATCLESPYFAKLACHAEEFAHSIGASLIIASSNYDFKTECERLKMFCRQGVSGIMICPWASTPEEESFYNTLDVPYVMLGRRLESVDCDAVLVNNQKAAQQMAEHLIEQGIKEFAYIGQAGKQHDQRLLGFRAGLLEHGILLPQDRIVQADYNSPEQCRADMARLLRKKHGGRLGVFCYHDLFATRAINLCHELEIRVPEEVAIAGFDDLPIASEIYPPLTTVSYPVRDIARLAFETLYTRIKFHSLNTGVCRYLDSTLIIRKSSVMPQKGMQK